MAKIDELDTKIALLEQKYASKENDMKFIFDSLSFKNVDIDSRIKENTDKINKLLLIIQELVSQGKTHKDLIEGLSKSHEELKTIKIDINGSPVGMPVSEFGKFIMNKISPDKKMHLWATRIREWGTVIVVILAIIFFIAMGIWSARQSSEFETIINLLQGLAK